MTTKAMVARATQSKGLRRITPFDVIVYLVMGLALLMWVVPFVYMIALSLSDAKAIINNQVSLFPVGMNLGAYQQIFNYPNFYLAYGNTFFYTFFGTFIALAMTVLFAYPLSKSFLRGHKPLLKMVVFSMFFSGGLIPTYLLISYMGLTGTRFAMLIPFAINSFNLIILINFFKALPGEIEEAALIDGLGYFGILRQIVLPLSGPALATIGLYYAVFFWNDWFNGLIYLNSKQYPVMLFLRNIVQGTAMVGDGAGSADRSNIAISVKSAVIIVSTLPIIILYPLLQRFFIAGLTVGSVKG
ncbi:MAG: carbohydrate ABC transporter permease [Candidatus Limiplasma sp.]|nr:carbohydrate ABC transporter permease [Candidatus Limiplasma sp.]